MSGIPYFDAHCDTVSRCLRDGGSLRENDGHLDLLRLGGFKKAAQFFAIFFNLSHAPADGMFAACRRQQEFFTRELEKHRELAAQCRTSEEVRRTNAEGRIAAVLSCEGAELLDCDPEKLDWARDVGIRAVNLCWNHANLICGSGRSEPERGLNDLGRAFAARAQENGILLDVSHCSDAAFWDLIQVTRAPVIATHSNARTICNHTRNLTDDMIRAIAETGGFIGVNLYAEFVSEGKTASMDEILRHFDHFLSLGVEKHIGLGADLDGCSPLAGNLRGVQDLPLLWDALRRRGFDEALCEDIFYNNLLRVME
ncbi:MAG: membrane dipeptidase [Oscillospiraceae bacterium]|nr:membrane dipeptidase [Oscillospiraceae bacterium]